MEQAIAYRTRSKAAALQQKSSQQVRSEITTETVAAQILTLEQSTEVIQTMLHSSISSIAYIRGLFGTSCFSEYSFNKSTIHWRYADFAAGIPQDTQRSNDEKSSQSRDKGVKCFVLQRGRNTKVDILLNTLGGAFEVLRNGWLRSLQLIISAKPGRPIHALETYTFNFSYKKDQNAQKIMDGCKVQGPSGEPVTIKTASTNQRDFMRYLIGMCSTMIELPDRRYLDIIIQYTDDCDPGYQPPGFTGCGVGEDDQLLYTTDPSWCVKKQAAAKITTGLHCLNADVIYTEPRDAEFDKMPQNMDHEMRLPVDQEVLEGISSSTIIIGSHLRQIPEIGSSNCVCETDVAGSQENPPNLLGDAYQCLNDEESSLIAGQDRFIDSHAHSEEPQAYPSIKTHENNHTQIAITQTETQLSEDARAAKRFQQMLDSQTNSSDIPDTLPTNSVEVQMSPNIPFEGKIILSQAKRTQLLSHSKRNNHVDIKAGVVSNGILEDVVDCQCRWNKEESGMVQCCFCMTWQHLTCYGFRGLHDARIPADHACYKCLLQGNEKAVLQDMERLALLRRGMRTVELMGFENDKKFSEALHCDLRLANDVVKHLFNDGFIIQNENIVRGGSPQLRMIQKYFDPMTYIGHHYQVQQETQLPSETQLNAMSQDIPPLSKSPTTGATASRRAAKTMKSLKFQSIDDTPVNAIVTEPQTPNGFRLHDKAQPSLHTDLYKEPTPRPQRKRCSDDGVSKGDIQLEPRKRIRKSRAEVQLKFDSSPAIDTTFKE